MEFQKQSLRPSIRKHNHRVDISSNVSSNILRQSYEAQLKPSSNHYSMTNIKQSSKQKKEKDRSYTESKENLMNYPMKKDSRSNHQMIRSIIERETAKQQKGKKQEVCKLQSNSMDNLNRNDKYDSRDVDRCSKSLDMKIIKEYVIKTPSLPQSQDLSTNSSTRDQLKQLAIENSNSEKTKQLLVTLSEINSNLPTQRTILIESNRALVQKTPTSYNIDSNLINISNIVLNHNRINNIDSKKVSGGIYGDRGIEQDNMKDNSQKLVHNMISRDKNCLYNHDAELVHELKKNSFGGRESQSKKQSMISSETESLDMNQKYLKNPRMSKDYTPAGKLIEDPTLLEKKFLEIAQEVKKGLDYLLKTKNSQIQNDSIKSKQSSIDETDQLRAHLKHMELENREKDIEIFNLCVHLQEITKISQSLMRKVYLPTE